MNDFAEIIRTACRQQQAVPDATFDELFPQELRGRSAVHWTPFDVALRVTQLFAREGVTRALDVGAGAGKVCLIGMLASELEWWGVEQDPTLVAAAKRAARLLAADQRARFVEGDAWSIDWSQFDGFYLFNPFNAVMLREHASPFVRYAMVRDQIRRAEDRLARARAGTHVATYHGFGGELPATYELVTREPAHEDMLELWVQRGRRG